MTTAPQIDSLTERQRECLRGVLALESAKETAKRLGLSEYTVKEHLGEARNRLGCATSAEAARAFARFDRTPGAKEGMLQEGTTIAIDLARSEPGRAAGTTAPSLREEYPPFGLDIASAAGSDRTETGSRLAGFSTKGLVFWTILLAVLVVFAIIAAPAMLKSVEDLLR
ncbi:helix-turn-helix domain-containing protein [Sphingomonas immobilis]|uniref:Helix-turn-helix transcriptional regulator n=1 Tax=Sphingomonas immobilis TaxID=3063997 RepID=A0ABT9A196_9SPHN|nr:helix-turn-helix transcriptional regulator [Sphingomonas sp. CA1-15]MDO7843601.1 helix-turn-helix transcriptional regulator [Sphingomonas sp. CA1-15]